MTKSIPFHASSGNHEQEISYAQDGKTIFTAMEKRYRFGSTPAVFTAVSQSTGIASSYAGVGTTVTTTTNTALASTSDKNFASFNSIAVSSYPKLQSGGLQAATITTTLNDNAGSANPARSGTMTDNFYKCQNSNGGVGKAYFRGNYDYGNSYHSYNAGLAHVIFLNPYVAYEFGSNQYKWLVADLAAVNTAQTPWIIVLTHGPLYNTNLNKHSTPGGTDPNGNPRWTTTGPGGTDPEEWGLLLSFERFFYQYGTKWTTHVSPYFDEFNLSDYTSLFY